MRDPARIRVVAVVASSGFGGAEQAFLSVLKGLDPNRFEMWVACHGSGPLLAEYRRHATDVWSMDALNIFNLKTVFELARRMRQVRCQMVISTMWTADVLAAAGAMLAGVPMRVATVQGEHFHADGARGWRRIRKAALSYLFRAPYLACDQVIAVSQSMADDLATRPGLRVDPQRITVIPNGIQLGEGRPNGVSKEQLGVPPGAPLVTTVANFLPNKGHQWLIQAMPEILAGAPEAVFALVGDGPERSKIAQWIAQAGVAHRVRLLGSRSDARSVMAASDLVVIPSAGAEGTPLAIMEALALGKPVVSTRLGGIPEIIEDRRNGLLVPPKDAPALAGAVLQVLLDPALAAGFAQEGRRTVEERFTDRHMVARTQSVYLQVAKSRGFGGASFIPVCEPVLDGREQAYVLDALQTGWISSAGPYITRFEEAFSRYCGTRYGVACSSGTTAIHLALAALGIGAGDEVVVPCFNLIVGASTVIWTGARPVLVDVDPDTWCLDPARVEAAITPRTKAILAVHMYGHPCDMEAINAIARRRGIPVIEDGAEAHGAEYRGRRVGGLGEIGCFSFYGNKILTTGEGGMLVTNDRKIAERAKLLRNQTFEEPRFVHRSLGFNYRLTNLQAAIGLAQCELIEQKVALKRTMASWYTERLRGVPGLTLPVEAPWARNVYWMYGVLCDDSQGYSRDALMRALAEQGIETRPFFHPMHQQPVFAQGGDSRYPDCRGSYPVSERLGRTGLYLPSSLNLTREQVGRVVDALITCLKATTRP